MKNANIRDFGEIIGSMLYKVEIKFFLKEKKITKKWNIFFRKEMRIKGGKWCSHGKCILLYYV
jgi:hypothetical protein